ncbi:MAG TPA: winged helix-turn-helix transcriptional regulator [Solirubrobacteraceae bacterium]|nr:winged helix-turn-helix transcriptional regulator [Solirubrobacteraceae bacterium]
MREHRYQQFCGLARALDVAGDRWTLLIVRELVPGPRRFTDLIDGLPGISRALLTERLRELEGEGVVARQELSPPAARQVYTLTDEGRDLAEAMSGLIAWGARRLGEREPVESFRARWMTVGMAALADREAARGVSETYQYVVGGSAFHFTVDDGAVRIDDGRAPDPAVTLTTDEDTWADIVSGRITASAAVATGALRVEGDRQAAKRLGRIFGRDRIFAQAEAAFA